MPLPDSNKSPKKIVLITHAPQGTLGDPSTALKFLSALKKQYGDEVELTLVVKMDIAANLANETENLEKINQLQVSQGVNFIPVPTRFNSNTPFDNTQIPSLLTQCDAIVLYPTPHFFSPNEKDFFTHFNKPILTGTEYDSINNDTFPYAVEFKTGLADNSLGIYLTDEKVATDSHLLGKIDEPNDVEIRDFLLGPKDIHPLLAQSEEDYFKSHDLYFGYFNNLNAQHPDSHVDPLRFIDTCIKKSRHQANHKKSIDIFLPLRDKETFIQVTDVFQYFQKPENNAIKIEYYKKDANGKLQCVNSMGSGTTVVRLINAFPLSSTAMDKMMKASDPFCLVTGDQSLSEAISNGKLLAYQIMDWKEQSFSHLITKCKTYLGNDSILAKFLALQKTPVTSKPQNMANWNDFVELVTHHEKQLLSEMSLFKSKLIQHDNLYNKLPELMTLINSPEVYIQKSIPKMVRQKDINKILSIFPDQKANYLQNLFEKIKKTPALSWIECAAVLTILENTVNRSDKQLILHKLINSLPTYIEFEAEPIRQSYFKSIDEVAHLLSDIENDQDKITLFGSLFASSYYDGSADKNEQYIWKYLLTTKESVHSKQQATIKMLANFNTVESKKLLLDFLFQDQKNHIYVQDFLKSVFFIDPTLQEVGKFLLREYTQPQDKKAILEFISQHLTPSLLQKPPNLYAFSNFDKIYHEYISCTEIKQFFIDPLKDKASERTLNYLDQVYALKQSNEAQIKRAQLIAPSLDASQQSLPSFDSRKPNDSTNPLQKKKGNTPTV